MIYRFDGFHLDARKRLLLRDGQTVELSSKAFDLLLVLVESGGRELGKDELMQHVWADQLVEDANLTVTMSHLRKALGEKATDHRFIVTIPGRGYRFVGELQTAEALIVEHHAVSQIVVEQEIDNGDESPRSRALRQESLAHGNGRDAGLTTGLEITAVDAISLPEVRGLGRSSVRWLAVGGLVVTMFAVLAFLYYRSHWKASDPLTPPFAGGTITQLTTRGNVSWAVLSPDGKFYAYSLRERGEYKESLWLAPTDAGNEIQLRSPITAVYKGMAFSPDSKTLYFTLGDTEPGQSGLFKIPLLGGPAARLSETINSRFSISPDGKQVASFRNSKDASTLVVTNLDGSGARELLKRPLDKPFFPRVTWSPDGASLAVVAIADSVKQDHEVFVVHAADGSVSQLTALDWILISNIAWLPDGRGLIIVATQKNETIRHLWHIDYPGGGAQRISHDTDTYGSGLGLSADGKSLLAVQQRRESNIWVAPASDLGRARQISFSSINGVYGLSGFDWTPDNRIVFAAGLDRTLALYSMDGNGGQLKQITSAGFYDQGPAVTLDGRFILFQSNRSGSNEIWRANADGSELRQLTKGGGNSFPQATPDGQWVVYVSARGNQNSVWRVSIDGGEPVRVTDRECANPRVSPDGKYLGCGYRGEDGAPQLALVQLAGDALVKEFKLPRSVESLDPIRWTPDAKSICYRDAANGLWCQSITGGAPQRLAGLPEEKLYVYGWSTDGKLFAFTRGREISDVVLLRDSR